MIFLSLVSACPFSLSWNTEDENRMKITNSFASLSFLKLYPLHFLPQGHTYIADADRRTASQLGTELRLETVRDLLPFVFALPLV